MSAIKVTSEQLKSTSSSLSSGSGEIDQITASLQGRVAALVDADWNGAASEAFRELWDKWHTGAGQVHEALQGISAMLGQAGQAYQDTEDQLSSQLRK